MVVVTLVFLQQSYLFRFIKVKVDMFGILETADSGSAGGCGSFIVCGNTAAGELSEQPQTLQ